MFLVRLLATMFLPEEHEVGLKDVPKMFLLRLLATMFLPEEHEVGLKDVPEVVVPIDGCGGVEGNVAEHLHADDGVDEEKHHHQHHHIGQGLAKRINNFREQIDKKNRNSLLQKTQD